MRLAYKSLCGHFPSKNCDLEHFNLHFRKWLHTRAAATCPRRTVGAKPINLSDSIGGKQPVYICSFTVYLAKSPRGKAPVKQGRFNEFVSTAVRVRSGCQGGGNLQAASCFKLQVKICD